jgi:unconventional prefoldin RPB5 interactor 1
VEALPASRQKEGLEKIQRDHRSHLLTRKELNDIFGRIDVKPASQIVDILTRRIDYVGRNVESLQKQLDMVENKFAAASVISNPDAVDENGSPMTNIVEVLDNDDNVVSYRLQQPGDVAPQIHELLEKAGIKDLPPLTKKPEDEELSGHKPTTTDTTEPTGHSSNPAVEPSTPAPTAMRKTVSFAEDIKPADEPNTTRSAERVQRIMSTAKEQEGLSRQQAVLPEDESPEDAALRREMLKYGMAEMGAIVAEMALVEPDSEDEDYDSTEEEDDSDVEDRFGRSTKSVLTDDYRRRMLDLETKLGVPSRLNQSPAVDQDELERDEGIGRIVIAPDTALTRPNASESSSNDIRAPTLLQKSNTERVVKKGVRFSDTLDIAEAKGETMAALQPDRPIIDPVGDVVERTDPPKPAGSRLGRKTSRFQQAQNSVALNRNVVFADGMSTTDRSGSSSGPQNAAEGQTLADRIVERDRPTASLDPDEDGDIAARQEVVEEYHRQRRRMIQRAGGFLKENDAPMQLLDEGTERMSKFRAARLSNQ